MNSQPNGYSQQTLGTTSVRPIIQPAGYQGQPMAQPIGQPIIQQQMGQPMYGVPPGYPNTIQPQTGPVVIAINYNLGLEQDYCSTCQRQTGHIYRHKIGCVAISWGIFLFALTGVFCCYPCLVDSYKDTEIVCINCSNVKQTIPAQCC